jgi:hypothetical protein
MPTLSRSDLLPLLRRACGDVFKLPSLDHHLAKAAVERWFAFELAAKLDPLLEPLGWVALVECGGVKGKLGSFDLLLVPRDKAPVHARIRPDVRTWPKEAIAIELKAAHLSDGDQGRTDALVDDLTKKPLLARDAGHECALFVGVLVTTSGLGASYQARAVEATKERAAKMPEPKLAAGLKGELVADRAVRYGEWHGHAWVEIVEAASPKVA